MPLALIETSHCNVDLKPSPIEPSWILEGNPEARSCPLSISADNAARTLIWSCTEGKFNWYYDVDETIVILEGSIVLESEGMPPKRYGVGDVIFFRKMACRGPCEEVRLLPPDQTVRARFGRPRPQQAEAHVLRPRQASRWARHRRRLTTFMRSRKRQIEGA
jgi:uncharacterized cupin superfamily protein